MSSMQIVLVDSLGDILFSGESWLGRGTEHPAANSDGRESESESEAYADGDATCPKTLRSGDSGIFASPRATAYGSNAAGTSSTDASNDQKRDERAA